ncbi:MAG TPA: hypothetical protein PK598_12850, partial [Thermoanaerobaculia bacterium]|nr:hypothetical protein [Thermoanaerobaculia bacterium]
RAPAGAEAIAVATDRQRRLFGRLSGVVGALAFAAWFNFGLFHLDHWVHVWDVFHLYMGAKYAPELEYTRLYACTAVAETEIGFAGEMAARQVRDLATNRVLPASDVVRVSASECRSRFGAVRWEAFRRDVAFFRSRISAERWRGSFEDHGYNATPAWGVAARLVAGVVPASDAGLVLLTLPDVLLILSLWGVAIGTFGLPASCVALVWWGLNSATDFGWIGGSFLRFDWLALVVFGVALLKKGRPAAAGAVLTGATLLRVFPGFVVAGLVLKALADAAAGRRFRLSRDHVRFGAGCVATLAVAVPLSGGVAAGGGPALGPWRGFVANSAKHLASPSMNNMGLRTVLSYTPQESIFVPPGEEAVAVWWSPHAEAFERRRLLFGVLVAGVVLLAALAARGRDDWVAACLGALLIPFAATVSSYYYGFLVVLGFLWLLRRGLGLAVALLATASPLISLAAPWPYVAYVLQSLAVLLLAGGTLAVLAFGPRPGPTGAGGT